MGAYLSQPKTDKISTDEFNDYLSVGASSMQGWRNSQEDAHNSILNFDTNTAFFAVYDGHGGAEVSTYCADKFPQFLKSIKAYVDGNYEDGLIDAFLGFDKTLLEPEVIEFLKVLAGEKNFVDGEDSDVMEEEEDLAELHEEGNLPLDEVMEKYKGHPSNPSLKKLKENNSSKPQSPYLRGRRAAAVIADAANRAELDPDSKPEGSSTSKAALEALQDGLTSSKSSSSNLGDKMETEEDSTVSSSSSSASKSNNTNKSCKNADEAEAVASESTADELFDNALNGKTTDATVPDSSAPKENEQNGNVSSSEVNKTDIQAKCLSTNDATVSGSSDTNKKESKHNGNVESSTKSAKKQDANSSAITSTSKGKSNASNDEDEENIDFDGNVSIARQVLEYSSEDEEGQEDDTTDEDADYDDEIEEDDEEADDEEDEESYLANEQFCANMIEEPGKDSGCTAVVALLNGRDLYVANAGDSRCVVCRNGKAIEMSLDHKPEDHEESTRITKAGGRVTLDGRVNGGLNLSRALGDHAYKMNHDLPAEEQMISALPDIKKLIISDEDEFMVLACDGIWNFMTSEEVVDFVRLRINDENKKMSEICEELFDACLAPNTLGDGTGCDNMTAVIVRFKPSILKLPTNINADETEDVFLAMQEKESGPKAQKRAASPTSGDNDPNEAENKTKRLKTDNEEENKTSSSSSKTNFTSCSSMPAITTDATSTTSTNEESSKTTDKEEVPKECDSAVASST